MTFLKKYILLFVVYAVLKIIGLFMNKLKSLIIAWAVALNWWNVAAQQIADVFWIANNAVDSSNDSLKCNISSIKMQDLKDDENVNNSVKKNKSKFQFGASVEIQSCLYDNFTFEKYSDNPWIHFLGSAMLPIGNKSNVSLSESVYYTPEKNNPTSENNITDLMLSQILSDKFSVDVWLEYSYYLKQKDADMLSVFLMLNYSPNDKITFTAVPYKPLLLDWKKISDFYFLSEYTYKLSSIVLIWVNTVTSCTDHWKTKVWFTLSCSMWNNLSLGLSTIPKESMSWNVSILPEWIQWTITSTF